MKKADLSADHYAGKYTRVARESQCYNVRMSKKVKRLFEQFKPTHYVVELRPEAESMSFSGRVVIDGIKTGRPSKRLVFHQKNLKIASASVTRHDKKSTNEITVSRINHHKAYDEVRLHSESMIYPGRYTVVLEFNGQITRAMNGIYPCFFEHDGSQKKLIATQFESHYAREVFPSIDEPEAKATFDLILTTPANETVLANTPVKSRKVIDGLVKTTFETTPKMSTYLLAFVYGEMSYKEAKTKDGVRLRTYATPDNTEFTAFALEVGIKCLEFYNDYFGIKYPLQKCDMVALPDFASGAMENWGLITFREQTMLVDPQNSSLDTRQYVAMVVAHELAHQWFGNLVTMRWWTDLWLNEGFASWIEFMAVDHLFPDWEMWTQFAVSEQQQAMKMDSLENTHPIEVPVKHPDEIHSIFDAISYSKGASVIHMLHQYLGPEAFRDGLRHHLTQHAYANASTVDLWAALEKVSGKPVKDFMHTWTSEPGFPVLLATVNDTVAAVRQERFFLNPKHTEPPKQLWPIALMATMKSAPQKLDTAEAKFAIQDSKNFMLNQGQSGFFRVAYDPLHLKKIGQRIKNGELSPVDRLGILSDVFETARAGKTSTVDALEFLDNFQNESNYAVWEIIAAGLGNMRLVMNSEELREAIKPFIRQLVAKELKRLDWNQKPNEPHFDRLLRPIIVGLAAGADESWVIDKCKELFAGITVPAVATTKMLSSIDPDLRGVVFGTVARHGGEVEFEKLVKLHNTLKLSEERNTLASAITGFKQPDLYTKALAMIDSDQVRLQDVPYWIAYSLMNHHARSQAWHWLQQKWPWLDKNLGNDLSFYRMPIYVARVHGDVSFIKEYESFFEPRLNPAMRRSYLQGLETLEWQSAWKKRDLSKILKFLGA